MSALHRIDRLRSSLAGIQGRGAHAGAVPGGSPWLAPWQLPSRSR